MKSSDVLRIKNVLGFDADGDMCLVNGTYEVLEYKPYEPSAYVWSPCWTLVPVNAPKDNWEHLVVDIDYDDFMLALDPAKYRKERQQEEDMEQWAQEEYERYGAVY